MDIKPLPRPGKAAGGYAREDISDDGAIVTVVTVVAVVAVVAVAVVAVVVKSRPVAA